VLWPALLTLAMCENVSASTKGNWKVVNYNCRCPDAKQIDSISSSGGCLRHLNMQDKMHGGFYDNDKKACYIAPTCNVCESVYGSSNIRVWGLSEQAAKKAKEVKEKAKRAKEKAKQKAKQKAKEVKEKAELTRLGALQDRCNGQRLLDKKVPVCNRIMALALASPKFDPKKTYACPQGWKWMKTSEFDASLSKLTQNCDGYVYFNRCGWKGNKWAGGPHKEYFLFSDSTSTDGYYSAGSRIHAGNKATRNPDHLNQAKAKYFAGIFCTKR